MESRMINGLFALFVTVLITLFSLIDVLIGTAQQ